MKVLFLPAMTKPSSLDIDSTSQFRIISTPTASHSSISIWIISRELPSQNNWPSFFSWYGIPCFSTSEIKSCGENLARADLQKFGFCERKFCALQFVFVKLHRPPPEIAIFFPTDDACSSTATFRPRLPASIAQKSPAAPAPIMMTSWVTKAVNGEWYEKVNGKWSMVNG